MRLAMSVLQRVETIAVAGEGYKSTLCRISSFLATIVRSSTFTCSTRRRPIRRFVNELGRSLGSPEMFAVTEGRYGLLVLARQRGIPVPDTAVINSVSDLAAWHKEHPLPWVLKSDGSWAGMGVRVVTSLSDAVDAFKEMSSPVRAGKVIGQALFEWDFFWLRPWFKAERCIISAQQHIAGNAANCALACWEGEVLASVAVEVVVTRSNNGPASVVRVIDGNEMVEAARQVVRACHMTGLVGFDFVLEAGTGTAFMVEMNPRAVPLCHIPLGPGRDLVQAMLEQITGASRKPRDRGDRTRSYHLLSGHVGGVPWQSPARGRLPRCSMARTCDVA